MIGARLARSVHAGREAAIASRRCATASLSPELLDFAAALIAPGRYGSVSEVVRAAMRNLEERELDFKEHRATRRMAPWPDAARALTA